MSRRRPNLTPRHRTAVAELQSSTQQSEDTILREKLDAPSTVYLCTKLNVHHRRGANPGHNTGENAGEFSGGINFGECNR